MARISTFCLLVLIATTPAFAATVVVDQVGTAFVPPDIVVQPGDTIEWHWASLAHTVTSGTPCTPDGVFFNEPLDSGNPLVTFLVPNDGTTFIPYFCIPHCAAPFFMQGTITIEGEVPAMSQWGMIITILLLVTAGVIVFRRRLATA